MTSSVIIGGGGGVAIVAAGGGAACLGFDDRDLDALWLKDCDCSRDCDGKDDSAAESAGGDIGWPTAEGDDEDDGDGDGDERDAFDEPALGGLDQTSDET